MDRAKAGDHNIRHYGNVGSLELVQSKPGSPYHMSLMTAMWRKENLLRVLGWVANGQEAKVVGQLEVGGSETAHDNRGRGVPILFELVSERQKCRQIAVAGGYEYGYGHGLPQLEQAGGCAAR